MKPITPVLRLALCALAGGPLLARADVPSNIIVRAMASRGYAAPASSPAGAKPATYLFYQGHFYRGATSDSSLQSATFDEIAHVLAPDLARQGYLPTKDLRQADLLIVVDWGATIGQDNPDILQEQENLNNSISATLRAPATPVLGLSGLHDAGIDDIMANDQVFYAEDIAADILMQGTARLLGIKGQFEHALKATVTATNGKSYAEAAIDDELKQDRYFLVVKAYDYQAIRKTGKAGRPLWSTRINLPAEAMAFSQALPAMSHAAAASFGTSSFHFREKDK